MWAMCALGSAVQLEGEGSVLWPAPGGAGVGVAV